MKLINCTPHAVTVVLESGTLEIEPSGIIPRCTQTSEQIGTVDIEGKTIPVIKTVFGEVFDLPEKQDDTFLIVSMLVASAAQRDDLLIPADIIRDDKGRIIGCKSLARV